MKKFFIETYGCQMNVSDSELVASILTKNGFEEAKNINEADIILFNTCSVRKKAEERVIGRVNNEVHRKKTKKNIKIGIIGCMAQNLQEDLFDENNQIDFVVGVDQYMQLPDIINNTKSHITETNLTNEEIYSDFTPIKHTKHYAFVTIMRGCNNFCSYCIVPYTRGRERSRPYEDIIQEIKKAVNQGFKEVRLLGQNVNSYLYQDVNFPELLRKVNEIENLDRIRFVTSHPKDLSDELIETIASCEKVCEHAHIALQSGNNEILDRMNRNYTIEHFKSIVKKLRNKMPDFSITTDIIAGFPGETDKQFLDTYNAMKEIEFDYAFTFKYSPREGTKAAEYEDQVAEHVRLTRLQKLIKLQQNITEKKYKDQIGKIKEVYVTKVSKKSDKELAGKTRDFKVTVFEGDKSLIGEIVKVKITDAVGWTLKGKLISE